MFSRRGRKQSSSPRTARVENNEEEPNPKSLLYLDHFVDILFTGKLRADENEQYQQFVIRDSGALHSLDKKLSLQVTQATVTPDVKKRTFRIVENESRLSQTTFTGVVKTQSKAHFAIWDYFFSVVQEASRLNDRYLCIAAGRIGIGPHGVIFKAMRKDDGQVVALKVVPRRIPDANASFSCTRVCRAIRDQWLRSPSLIQVLDVFHSKNETQILMPLLGPTLNALLSTPWHEAKAQVLFRRLIHALSAMHRVGFVHGSIVPGNIMVEAEYPSLAIRLGGFGLSVVTDKHISPDYIPKRSLARVQRGLAREGLQYLAPELLEDMGNISPAIDLWALGVTLFRVLMGELPFSQPGLSNGNGVLSAMKQYCDAPELMLERLLFPPESSHTTRFSSDAISVIVKLLSPDPDRRGDIASFARHPWVLPVDSPRSSPCSSKT